MICLKYLRLFLPFLLLTLGGCYKPSPPPTHLFDKVQKDEAFTTYEFKKPKALHNVRELISVPPKPSYKKNKNLILLIADTYIQKTLRENLESFFPEFQKTSLADLIWWTWYRDIQKIYDKVLILSLPQARYKNLIKSLQYMENQDKKYDLFILSHGFSNHLTDGQPGYFLSYKEIYKLTLKNLDLIFMQGCQSETLRLDWHNAGAQKVLAFEGLNRNFFYIHFFLKNYALSSSIKKAHKKTLKDLKNPQRYFGLPKTLILHGLGISLEDYIKNSENPSLSNSSTYN